MCIGWQAAVLLTCLSWAEMQPVWGPRVSGAALCAAHVSVQHGQHHQPGCRPWPPMHAHPPQHVCASEATAAPSACLVLGFMVLMHPAREQAHCLSCKHPRIGPYAHCCMHWSGRCPSEPTETSARSKRRFNNCQAPWISILGPLLASNTCLQRYWLNRATQNVLLCTRLNC